MLSSSLCFLSRNTCRQKLPFQTPVPQTSSKSHPTLLLAFSILPAGWRGNPAAPLGPRERPAELLLPALSPGFHGPGRPHFLPGRCSGDLRPGSPLPRVPPQVQLTPSFERHGYCSSSLRAALRPQKRLRKENGRTVSRARGAPSEAEGHAAAREAARRRPCGGERCGGGGRGAWGG